MCGCVTGVSAFLVQNGLSGCRTGAELPVHPDGSHRRLEAALMATIVLSKMRRIVLSWALSLFAMLCWPVSRKSEPDL